MKEVAPELSEIAAVDLGSNSFRLQMARLVDGQLVFHDSLREMVRLGAGIGKDGCLDAESQQRALDCLRRFGERLRGLPPAAVRAVATNTFRIARNAPQFVEAAQQALGFPIDIIAGREEARMIFIGVSHDLPQAAHKRLVVDIGGGSTEFVVGQGYAPHEMESLYMGCVSYSMRFFGDGKLSEKNLHQAEIAARTEVQTICSHFSAGHWTEAVGSSGTARALGEVLRLQGWSDGSITRAGLEKLRELLIKTGELKKLDFSGIGAERAPSFPGGYAIMHAVFAELGIEEMSVASGALREGVLYELLGRIHHHDIREDTVARFKRRYHVDAQQARRVQMVARRLLEPIAHNLKQGRAAAEQFLAWASRLHEIGMSIAHGGYHKHSAYIVENADMPGFSKYEQELLGLLMRCQRRSLAKAAPIPDVTDDRCALILILRLAILLRRNRQESAIPHIQLSWNEGGFRLNLEQGWLQLNPLSELALEAEVGYWKDVGVDLVLE